MRVLVLGGTRFIGRHLVETLMAGGHRVASFARGVTPDELPSEVERIRGDRNAGARGLEALSDGAWDVCIDVSGYTPMQVRASAQMLKGRVHRYVFISSVSVYEDSGDVPVRETHALLPAAAEDVTEITGETYGPLKVTCEHIVQEIFGERGSVLRPQIVAGPWDPTGRHTYWVQRATEGGEMLAPGDGSDHVQVVDVRDIARFTARMIDADIGGTFNMAGPRLTWAAFIEALGAERPVWVPRSILEAGGLTFVELPMYRPDGAERSSLMHVSVERAQAAGFTVTDARVTITDVRAWLATHPVPPALPPERERELIARAKSSGPHGRPAN
jgi:2'-hydroxyisoflavone reductase